MTRTRREIQRSLNGSAKFFRVSGIVETGGMAYSGK
jgi:hypothetical protein